jgi:signal transduction histidine kinase
VLELAGTVTRLGSGDRGATVPMRSADEVGQLAAAFNRMSEALARTTVSKSELERLAGRLISAQEDERRRVGRELHDDLVQRVAATAIELGRLERLPSEADRRAGLTQLRQTLVQLSQDVHQLSRRIHPAMLDEQGLPAAIEAECRAFMERGGPPVDVRIDGSLDDLDKDATLALYRIVQESLRNAWLHANASDVRVLITRTGSTVHLTIGDNGEGFDRAAPGWKAGLGLASMEERVRLLGGTLVVTSAPGAGTRVAATLPLHPSHAETTHPAG